MYNVYIRIYSLSSTLHMPSSPAWQFQHFLSLSLQFQLTFSQLRVCWRILHLAFYATLVPFENGRFKRLLSAILALSFSRHPSFKLDPESREAKQLAILIRGKTLWVPAMPDPGWENLDFMLILMSNQRIFAFGIRKHWWKPYLSVLFIKKQLDSSFRKDVSSKEINSIFGNTEVF